MRFLRLTFIFGTRFSVPGTNLISNPFRVWGSVSLELPVTIKFFTVIAILSKIFQLFDAFCPFSTQWTTVIVNILIQVKRSVSPLEQAVFIGSVTAFVLVLRRFECGRVPIFACPLLCEHGARRVASSGKRVRCPLLIVNAGQ